MTRKTEEQDHLHIPIVVAIANHQRFHLCVYSTVCMNYNNDCFHYACDFVRLVHLDSDYLDCDSERRSAQMESQTDQLNGLQYNCTLIKNPLINWCSPLTCHNFHDIRSHLDWYRMALQKTARHGKCHIQCMLNRWSSLSVVGGSCQNWETPLLPSKPRQQFTSITSCRHRHSRRWCWCTGHILQMFIKSVLIFAGKSLRMKFQI